mgnify:CR=1 FL=1
MKISESYFIYSLGGDYVRESDMSDELLFAIRTGLQYRPHKLTAGRPRIGSSFRSCRDDSLPLDELPLNHPRHPINSVMFQITPLATQHDEELDKAQERRNKVMRDALTNLG